MVETISSCALSVFEKPRSCSHLVIATQTSMLPNTRGIFSRKLRHQIDAEMFFAHWNTVYQESAWMEWKLLRAIVRTHIPCSQDTDAYNYPGRTKIGNPCYIPHIPQCALAFFAKSLGEKICSVEFIYSSSISNSFLPKFSKKNFGMWDIRYVCKSIERFISWTDHIHKFTPWFHTWVPVLFSCHRGLLNELTGIDPLRCLAALKVSIFFSPDIRNLSNDLSWNLHVCVIPSINRYLGAKDLKKKPDIFLWTARCLIALSAMLLFQGILSYSVNVKRLCRYRLKRLWYLIVKSEW